MSEENLEVPVAELSYEQAREQLVAAISQLESGKLGLEESLKVWERGEQLASHCQSFLDQAKQRLEQAKKSE
ncbi:MAG: exodeoxyribonuclease VII small subunit [Varibaculum cambriense]|uniref:exodeoxyribonuclease VII small subunit n=1 Tax=Varibaculum cambriense TaxID=184870 RepID=UPI00241E580A|nr:exodeoxyribonuclease VII small subunit [Varibaculum cambriense]MBS6754488.1 exodeoxyribonuclease VII small subunit [Varibaculum cambriense]